MEEMYRKFQDQCCDTKGAKASKKGCENWNFYYNSGIGHIQKFWWKLFRQ